MPLNILDVEDAFLQGRAVWEEFINQAGQEFYAPLGKRIIGSLYSNLDPDALAMLQQQSPQTLGWLENQFEGRE